MGEGSTGLKTLTRSCLDSRRRCLGSDRKFETCVAKQCFIVKATTIEQFATNVCEKAQKFNSELTGEGLQIEGDIEDACKVFCKTKSNGPKSRSWTFPDGTTCRSKRYGADDISYCIAGRCEKFSCDNSTSNYFKMDPKFCQYRNPPPHQQSLSNEMDRKHDTQNNSITKPRNIDKDQQSQSNNHRVTYGPTTMRNKYENGELKNIFSS